MPTSLANVHPTLVSKVSQLLEAMRVLGFPMVITAGLRTSEQQAALYRQGRTIPGAIVTHVDGTNRRSMHQAQDDGFGHAVDCAFLVDEKPSWDGNLPWRTYGYCAKALDLQWGGDWLRFPDRPHIEIPMKRSDVRIA